MHVVVVLARVAHALPQRPQFRTSVKPFISHPSAAIMLQSPNPGVHVKVHALSVPQRAIVEFTGAGHASGRVASPSGLHTVRAVIPTAHVAVPGVHTQPAHIVPVQVDALGHGSVMKLVPSELHARTVRASRHMDVPGVHASSVHTPSTQRCDGLHAIGIVPKPSGLHTIRIVVDAHVAAPGTQLRVTQTPSRHPSLGAQLTDIVDRPSGAHTLRSVIDAHVAVPGMHERATHVPALQLSSAAHGIAT
jgi:hypothetical protein